jgi:hypothetical protein
MCVTADERFFRGRGGELGWVYLFMYDSGTLCALHMLV